MQACVCVEICLGWRLGGPACSPEQACPNRRASARMPAKASGLALLLLLLLQWS